MGTDIHFVVERKTPDGWTVVPGPMRTCWSCEGSGKDKRQKDESCYWCKGAGKKQEEFYEGRNYGLFAILADVRNGRGFAGVITGAGYKPISGPRGLPEDISEEARTYLDEHGDHTPSWLTLKELLDYDWSQTTVLYGTVAPAEYLAFKAKGKPDNWSGGVFGGRTEIVTQSEMDRLLALGEARADEGMMGSRTTAVEAKHYYTQVQWTETYAEVADDFLKVLHEELQPLGRPDQVRCVFNFDS